jgi:hypothetical protein
MKKIEEYKNGFSLQKAETTDDFIKHEKMLYRAFFDKYSWYADLCFNVNEDRLIPKVPYENQEIYFLMKNHEIVSGYSFCLNHKQSFEIEMMGYKFQKDETVCEGLHYYSDLDEKYNKLELIATGIQASRYIDNYLRIKGIKSIYSSCEEKYVGAYKKIGYKKISELKNEIFEEAILVKNI